MIAAEIQQQGVISFARFMALALYHPEFGYYERNHPQTGRAGDFYTSVSVGSLFGELLGFCFARTLASLPGVVHLVESGAHDGQLAHDILSYLEQFQPSLFERVRYCILEPSTRRRENQQARLQKFAGRVDWRSAWEQFSYRGVCFSNELLDAMPVHLFRWSADERTWREWGVGEENGERVLKPIPVGAENQAAMALLPLVPDALAAILPDGFATEVSPATLAWWENAAAALEEGMLITADYGLEQADYLRPERKAGTLRGFSRHHLTGDLLAAPGQQDITAHVNFTLLAQAGERQGLQTSALLQQGSFLKQILEQVESSPGQFPSWTPSRTRQLATLMHPEHLGRAFRVLAQTRSG